MDSDFLEQRFANIFVDSLSSMLKNMLDVNIEKSATERRYGYHIGAGYDVAIGVLGDIRANILYEFESDFANSATEILGNKKMKDYDSRGEFCTILRGVISEIANIASGNAIGLLADENIDCDITPPLVYYGKGLQILPRNQETLCIKFSSKLGKIILNIAMEVNEKISV